MAVIPLQEIMAKRQINQPAQNSARTYVGFDVGFLRQL